MKFKKQVLAILVIYLLTGCSQLPLREFVLENENCEAIDFFDAYAYSKAQANRLIYEKVKNKNINTLIFHTDENMKVVYNEYRKTLEEKFRRQEEEERLKNGIKPGDGIGCDLLVTVNNGLEEEPFLSGIKPKDLNWYHGVLLSCPVGNDT